MSGITGIEFGPDSCVLVRARRRADAIELTAGHSIEAWPAQDSVATDLLKRLRQEKGFPRIARVVAWGLAEGAGARDPATRAALRPLIAAGFRIDSVISPPQALGILAAALPRPGDASVWLAINRHGAAIGIVRSGGELLYSRSFGWNWEAAAIGSQAQLLQRYSIVAHLAPEVRRGVDLVRARYGAQVSAAVTCGDLPDLRSLTMPLIEELDLEVETLDSAEGLMIPPTARRDRLPDSLSAVRLACAAAAGPAASDRNLAVVRLARAAGFAAAVLGLAWAGYVWWTRPQGAVSQPVSVTAGKPADTRASAPPAESARAPMPSDTPAASPSIPQAAASPPVSSPSAISTGRVDDSSPIAPEPARSAAPNPTPPRANRPSPRVELPQTAGAPGLGALQRPTAQSAPASTDTPPARQRPQPQAAPAVADRRETVPPAAIPPATAPAPASRAARPVPLREPLPVIDTILVSSDRRIAVIEGAMVGVGDTVGARSVVRIEVDAVFLREPSGLEIRVPIRVRRAP